MILDSFRLDGKVAIVTGANTGLGQGMCVALAEAGAKVVGVARRDCNETEEKVKAVGGEFLHIQADLSSMEPVERIINETVARFNRVDILVNNAGIIKREDALEYSEQEWDDVVFINQKFVFFLSQAAANQFVKQGDGGKIINIASMLSYQGGIRVPAYTASKSAILGLTKAMANEWASFNININAIAPGYMETNNTKALRSDEKRNDEILSRIPAKRWGTPQDMMGAVVFLASDAASYVNGFTLAVDGGWLAR
ncbi:MAG: 2-dehydro-3-deoxy-D-gluconate 5-dehydrogenase KduD [bacterium]|nr:2-dehydro-3-deoxy-D-gluconate 5-dehydrogenase KduD [bacterium]